MSLYTNTFDLQITKKENMGLMIVHNGLLLKINTEKNCIEYSKNKGMSWHFQGSISSNFGTFIELSNDEDLLLAITTKGVYHSKNDGKSWHK